MVFPTRRRLGVCPPPPPSHTHNQPPPRTHAAAPPSTCPHAHLDLGLQPHTLGQGGPVLEQLVIERLLRLLYEGAPPDASAGPGAAAAAAATAAAGEDTEVRVGASGEGGGGTRRARLQRAPHCGIWRPGGRGWWWWCRCCGRRASSPAAPRWGCCKSPAYCGCLSRALLHVPATRRALLAGVVSRRPRSQCVCTVPRPATRQGEEAGGGGTNEGTSLGERGKQSWAAGVWRAAPVN